MLFFVADFANRSRLLAERATLFHYTYIHIISWWIRRRILTLNGKLSNHSTDLLSNKCKSLYLPARRRRRVRTMGPSTKLWPNNTQSTLWNCSEERSRRHLLRPINNSSCMNLCFPVFRQYCRLVPERRLTPICSLQLFLFIFSSKR